MRRSALALAAIVALAGGDAGARPAGGHHVASDPFSGRPVWATDHAAGRVLVLSARSGRVLRALGGCDGAHHVAAGPPGRAVAACHDPGRLLVVAASGRRLGSTRVGHGLHGVALAVAP